MNKFVEWHRIIPETKLSSLTVLTSANCFAIPSEAKANSEIGTSTKTRYLLLQNGMLDCTESNEPDHFSVK
jgi:hypothetical protein